MISFIVKACNCHVPPFSFRQLKILAPRTLLASDGRFYLSRVCQYVSYFNMYFIHLCQLTSTVRHERDF